MNKKQTPFLSTEGDHDADTDTEPAGGFRVRGGARDAADIRLAARAGARHWAGDADVGCGVFLMGIVRRDAASQRRCGREEIVSRFNFSGNARRSLRCRRRSGKSLGRRR